VVNLLQSRSGPRGGYRRKLRLEDKLVDGLLLARKPACDGERPGDLAGVIAELAARIDEQELPFSNAAIVFPIVKDARIGARADDAPVGRPLRPVTAERIKKQRFDLIFVH